MTKEERKELEIEAEMLKELLKIHNEIADKIESMTQDEHLNYRLDMMARIAEIEKILKEN
ncbi:MAG: hypothetical protein MUE85_13605 [Microscillaceae bacterium]|jgi:hypothetical protein|nr:hypothetical protein [Microscillaceae bacterium]